MLTMLQANTIVDAALAEGRKLGLAPLAVVVLDAGGHLIVAKREDGAGILRSDIAFGKAWGSLGMGFSSRELASRAAAMPAFFGMLATSSGGRLVASPGGLLIHDDDGQLVGAIGISGDLGDQDEICAAAGIAAASLHSTPIS
jgi:uncharacterized protein GlcG (DUF336 family)